MPDLCNAKIGYTEFGAYDQPAQWIIPTISFSKVKKAVEKYEQHSRGNLTGQLLASNHKYFTYQAKFERTGIDKNGKQTALLTDLYNLDTHKKVTSHIWLKHQDYKQISNIKEIKPKSVVSFSAMVRFYWKDKNRPILLFDFSLCQIHNSHVKSQRST